MGVLASYVFSSVSDGILPHLREPVEEVFNGVVQHKGLPTRQDFRDLRNRVDMLDYNAREATKVLHEIKGQLKRTLEVIDAAQSRLQGK